MSATIVVGTDGSEHAERAVEWCAAHASPLGAEVVAVHVIETLAYLGGRPPYVWLNTPSAEQREGLEDHVAREWCKPLANAGVPFRVLVVDGHPATALMDAARSEDAMLVVTGRRGLGGFKELLLGSTSHQLSHHLDRPLVLVP
jgi:nucleotide-binding universal stress UspA family protein